MTAFAQASPWPPTADRTVRSLRHLEANASTSRTLNLITVWRRNAGSPEYAANPLFRNQILNRSIIVKHRLRSHEREEFPDGRSVATKVILPLDITDLRAGARSFFVGQRGYRPILEELLGPGELLGGRDEELLRMLDAMPSLDPFLMRERLKRRGYAPDRCYFDISVADTERMFEFVRNEVAPLIGLSFTDMDARFDDRISKLAGKILAIDCDDELEPFRHGLGMDKTSFDEGVFCWKGFIYYKWALLDLLPKIRPVTLEIAAVQPSGPVSEDERNFIVNARRRLVGSVSLTCQTVRSTLNLYDDAYRDLTVNGQPKAFREFLMTAPRLFQEIGERIGAVNHIISFWRFRFPKGVRTQVHAEELSDLLADFEMSVSF